MSAKTIKHYSDAKNAKGLRHWSGSWRGAGEVRRRFHRSDRHETRRRLKTH